jgi:potassium efflux system protein
MHISRNSIRKCILKILPAIFTFFILLYTSFCRVSAQNISSGKPETNKVQKIFSISDIAGEAEHTKVVVQDIRSQFLPLQNIRTLQQKAKALHSKIAESRRNFRKQNLQEISINGLMDLRKQWNHLSQKLSEQQKYLDSRLKVLDSGLNRIATLQTRWTHLKDTLSEKGFTDVVTSQIQPVKVSLNGVESDLKNRLDILLSVQNSLSNDGMIVSDILNQLNIEMEQAQIRLFEPDRPPLWKVLSAQSDSSLQAQLQNYHSGRLTTFTRFVRENKDRIFLQIAILVILLFAVYDLKRRTLKKLRADSSTSSSVVHILSRPISVALLITLAITPLIYPDAPLEIIRLFNTLIVFPLLRILPGLLPDMLRKPLYYLIALFFFHRLHDQAFEQILLQRLMLLVLTVLTFIWTFWLVKSEGILYKIKTSRILKFITVLGRISLFILVVSFLANLFGYISLATLLTTAFLKSIYMGIALYTLLRIADTLITIMMNSTLAQTLRMVRRHNEILVSRMRKFVQFVIVGFWLYDILINYTLASPLLKIIDSILVKRLSVGDLSISLGNVLAFLFTIWLSILISRFIRFVFDEDLYPRLHLSRGVPATISLLLNYSIIALGFLAAISAAGMDLSRLAILAGALGIGIGFGLQNLVNNFVSGLILIFERPIKAGDTIEFGSLLGTVLRIGIRSSTVRTFEGAEVIVPNGNIISSEVVNWTLSDRLRRIEVLVGVAYGTDPEKVIQILKGVVQDRQDVLKTPAPVVLFTDFGDSSLNFSLRFWTDNFEEWLNLKSEVTVMVSNALKEANIEIPFPQRDLHLRSVDPEVSENIARQNNSSQK